MHYLCSFTLNACGWERLLKEVGIVLTIAEQALGESATELAPAVSPAVCSVASACIYIWPRSHIVSYCYRREKGIRYQDVVTRMFNLFARVSMYTSGQAGEHELCGSSRTEDTCLVSEFPVFSQ
jgi:hypothetical protein